MQHEKREMRPTWSAWAHLTFLILIAGVAGLAADHLIGSNWPAFQTSLPLGPYLVVVAAGSAAICLSVGWMRSDPIALVTFAMALSGWTYVGCVILVGDAAPPAPGDFFSALHFVLAYVLTVMTVVGALYSLAIAWDRTCR